MAKNLISGLSLARLTQIWATNFFSWVLSLLEVRHVANYHRIQFQGKLMIQTQENGEKPHFGPGLGPLGPNLARQIFF